MTGKVGRPKGKPQPQLIQFPGILGEMRVAYNRMKAQAKFRREEWGLTWQDFIDIWDGQWHKRGRSVDDCCLTRYDWWGSWDKTNTYVTTRKEHFRQQGLHRAEVRRTLQGN